MAEYNFKRLSDVEALPEVPEGANAFIEVDGEVKRVPSNGFGGAGGSDILSVAIVNDGSSYTCNKTYEEVKNALINNIPIFATRVRPNYTYTGYPYQDSYYAVEFDESNVICFHGSGGTIILDSDNSVYQPAPI